MMMTSGEKVGLTHARTTGLTQSPFPHVGPLQVIH